MKTITYTILAATVICGCIHEPQVIPWEFDDLDKNWDGYLSKKEAAVRKDLGNEWDSIDLNSDGKLNIDEFSAFEGRGRFTPPHGAHEPGNSPY